MYENSEEEIPVIVESDAYERGFKDMVQNLFELDD